MSDFPSKSRASKNRVWAIYLTFCIFLIHLFINYILNTSFFYLSIIYFVQSFRNIYKQKLFSSSMFPDTPIYFYSFHDVWEVVNVTVSIFKPIVHLLLNLLMASDNVAYYNYLSWLSITKFQGLTLIFLSSILMIDICFLKINVFEIWILLTQHQSFW